MSDLLGELAAVLAPADARERLSGNRSAVRQPVHTLYVPVPNFRATTPRDYGDVALRMLDEHLPPLGEDVLPRVREKLGAQPVEDLRVDFEDGYGSPGDAEEDAAAELAGAAIARAVGAGDAPFLWGVRVKGLQSATRARGLRTLQLVVRSAVEAGGLPERFVVTWPKVAHVAEAQAAVLISERLESEHGLASGSLRFELQIEVPAAVVGPDGLATVAALIQASAGRCEGLHYGTYDFSAAAGVPATEQSLEHPLADHAKAVMQLAAAGTGVAVSDGSTNIVPVGDGVVEAWQLHARLVDRALRRGLYQGWDLHPAQLVTRYGATYAFLRGELAATAPRLRAYAERSAAGVLDEPATAQALAATALRALECGACDDDEVVSATGLDRDALARLVRREG